MAVACGASVSQMVSVPRTPLSGSRPETLRSCPQLASVFGATNGSRVVAMATKKAITTAPKKAFGTAQKNFGSAQKSFGSAQKSFGSVQKKFGSPFGKKDTGGKLSWLPGIKIGSFTDPEWLDGSLPGDYGFDPLGLGKDPSALKWYREAEIIHGRWAMAAVIGIFVGQAWSGVPWYEAGAEPGAVAPFSFGTLLGTQLLLMGWVETKRWIDFLEPGSQLVDWSTPWSRTAENFGNATGLQGYPGGKFFDPFALGGDIKNGKYITDYNKLSRLQLAEIKHARIAMLALLTFYFEAGQGLTPLSALGL